jgi:hypothetical protein
VRQPGNALRWYRCERVASIPGRRSRASPTDGAPCIALARQSSGSVAPRKLDHPNRARIDGQVVEAVNGMSRAMREAGLVAAYRRGYGEHPREEWAGTIGLAVLQQDRAAGAVCGGRGKSSGTFGCGR